MDLSTRSLGLELPNPLVCGASPLGWDLGLVRRLEDAGARAAGDLLGPLISGSPVHQLETSAP